MRDIENDLGERREGSYTRTDTTLTISPYSESVLTNIPRSYQEESGMARPFDCLLYPLLPTSSYLSPIIIVSRTIWPIMKSLSWISYLGHLSFLDQSNLVHNETSLVLSAQRLILTRASSEQPFKAMLLKGVLDFNIRQISQSTLNLKDLDLQQATRNYQTRAQNSKANLTTDKWDQYAQYITN